VDGGKGAVALERHLWEPQRGKKRGHQKGNKGKRGNHVRVWIIGLGGKGGGQGREFLSDKELHRKEGDSDDLPFSKKRGEDIWDILTRTSPRLGETVFLSSKRIHPCRKKG